LSISEVERTDYAAADGPRIPTLDEGSTNQEECKSDEAQKGTLLLRYE
jgi:hypothetical protein